MDSTLLGKSSVPPKVPQRGPYPTMAELLSDGTLSVTNWTQTTRVMFVSAMPNSATPDFTFVDGTGESLATGSTNYVGGSPDEEGTMVQEPRECITFSCIVPPRTSLQIARTTMDPDSIILTRMAFELEEHSAKEAQPAAVFPCFPLPGPRPYLCTQVHTRTGFVSQLHHEVGLAHRGMVGG